MTLTSTLALAFTLTLSSALALACSAYGTACPSDRGVGERIMAWLSPREPFSIGTCLIQWGVLLALGLALNRWLARKSTGAA